MTDLLESGRANLRSVIDEMIAANPNDEGEDNNAVSSSSSTCQRENNVNNRNVRPR